MGSPALACVTEFDLMRCLGKYVIVDSGVRLAMMSWLCCSVIMQYELAEIIMKC
jgi:hypothetical protein